PALPRPAGGPQAAAAHPPSNAEAPAERGKVPAPATPADVPHEPARLATWSAFHEQVAALPEEEREVFDLLWYQGLPQAEAAELLHVNVRTIKRRWVSARMKIQYA